MDGAEDRSAAAFLSATDGAPVLAIADVWHVWRDPVTGDEVPSCTIVMSRASAWMTPYHDRLPVLLAEADVDAWLSGEVTPGMLRSVVEAALREWTVSKRFNKTESGDGNSTLIDPFDEVA